MRPQCCKQSARGIVPAEEAPAGYAKPCVGQPGLQLSILGWCLRPPQLLSSSRGGGHDIPHVVNKPRISFATPTQNSPRRSVHAPMLAPSALVS